MLKPPKVKLEPLWEETYLAAVKNSVGTAMFRNAYVRQGRKRFDALNDGELSCAMFASSVLYLYGRLPKTYATVYRTVEALLAAGGRKVGTSRLKPGDVLVWVPTSEKSGPHNHIGFYLGNGKAVSNNAKTGKVAMHDVTFKGKRGLEMAIRPDWRRNA